MRTLQDVLPGQLVKVSRLCDNGAIKRHLLDMGINRDTEIRVLRNAPWEGLVKVNICGYERNLRKADVDAIEIWES
jgi:ferrous iron transport protein A